MPKSPSNPKPEASLAKLAALFASMFIVSLGICGYRKPPRLCMHASFRNHFAIKVGEFLEKPDVLQ